MDPIERQEINTLFAPRYGEPVGFGITASVFAKGGTAVKVYGKDIPIDEIYKEAYMLAYMERVNIRTSRVLQVLSADGYRIMEMSIVKGKPLLFILNDALARGDNDKARGIIEKMAKIQSEVNSINASDLPAYKSYARRLIENNPALDAARQRKLLGLLAELPDGGSLCHGDLHPNNILVDDGGNWTVIDWPEAASGDRCADASRTYADVGHPAFIHAGGINLPEAYLSAYCSAAGIEAKDVLKWMPIQAGMLYGYKEPDFCAALEKYLPA